MFSEDSLEHYAYCPIVGDYARSKLRLPAHLSHGLRAFMCLESDVSDEDATLQLLLLYAVYTATNQLRFGVKCRRTLNGHVLLQQFVQQGAASSSKAQQIVDSIYHRHQSARRRLS